MIIDYLTLPDRQLAYQRLIGDTCKAGVMFLSGFASDMTGTKVTYLNERCCESGLSFIGFDYRGCGRSTGVFSEGTIGAWYEDACAIFEHLTQGPQIVVGSSMGGWLALKLALRYPERVQALIGIAAAPDFTEDLIWGRLSVEQKLKLCSEGYLFDEQSPPDHKVPITFQLIEEGRQHLLLRTPLDLKCPIHLLQGMKDQEVPWRYAKLIAEAVTHADVCTTFIKEGDHRLSRSQDLKLLWQTVALYL